MGERFIARADEVLGAHGVLLELAEEMGRAQCPAFFRGAARIQVVPHDLEEHAALGGPFTLIETMKGRRIAYVEAHTCSRLFTDRRSVRELEEQYGLPRAQALTPRESLAHIEKLLGES
ncbi:Scr1 family TA system antitoxin-like transcriptional regulator [Streptomyces hygroscopicus]|uniref:Scr1 family TA system antitoxin-like transcriptional regulator n=1 Tax=Streptomyces hygroscopicus TaxID=1912 RepID=UPI002AD2D412|nr:Scr1 family TA system antitoxin-like transcriptional regulator [Streptomyces hygroscopicus]